MLKRRGLLLGMGSALLAPAVVHAENIMAIRPISVFSSTPVADELEWYVRRHKPIPPDVWRVERTVFVGPSDRLIFKKCGVVGVFDDFLLGTDRPFFHIEGRQKGKWEDLELSAEQRAQRRSDK